MRGADVTEQATLDPSGESGAEVGRYADAREGDLHGLVILAQGFPYWLVPRGSDWVLLVEAPAADALREELARFDRENASWPPPLQMPPPIAAPSSFLTPLLWALAVLGAFAWQGRIPGVTAWGTLDAEALFGRLQWWRPASALFFHADAGHLVSNLVPGIFVFSAVLSTFGLRSGWLLLGGCAFVANSLSAALHLPGPYHSLGASTALFAGLGLLTGQATVTVRHLPRLRRWRGVFAPLGAGAILFALYGAGGPRVDLGAHVAGFVTGLLTGTVAAWRRFPQPDPMSSR